MGSKYRFADNWMCGTSGRSRQSGSISDGKQVMTFGKWRVIKPFSTFAVIHNKIYSEKNVLAKQLNENYSHSISRLPIEVIENSKPTLEFFADQFAKEKINGDFDYLISAVYTERITKLEPNGRKLAGMVYPSVRTEGEAMNVALSPWVIKEGSIQLTMVMQCTVHKKGNQVVTNNEKIATIKPNDTKINWEPITDPKEYFEPHIIQKILNGEIA